MDERDQTDDARLREMARHRGLKLVGSRRRKAGGDFGKYGLKSATTDEPCLGIGADGLEATAEEILAFLRGSAADRWKGSLSSSGPASDRPPKASPAKPSRDVPAAQMPTPKREARTASGGKKRRPRIADPVPDPEMKAAKLSLREARKTDAAALAALLGCLSESVDQAWISEHLEEAARREEPVILAEREAVVGMVAYHVFGVPHRTRPVGRISLVMVMESERRRGIGRALAHAALARLESLGCTQIEMISEIGFGEAGRFARAVGFEGRDYRFVRDRRD